MRSGCKLKNRPASDNVTYFSPLVDLSTESAARTITQDCAIGGDSKSEARETSKTRESVSAAAMDAWRSPDSSRDRKAFDNPLRAANSCIVQPRRCRSSRNRVAKEESCTWMPSSAPCCLTGNFVVIKTTTHKHA